MCSNDFSAHWKISTFREWEEENELVKKGARNGKGHRQRTVWVQSQKLRGESSKKEEMANNVDRSSTELIGSRKPGCTG